MRRGSLTLHSFPYRVAEEHGQGGRDKKTGNGVQTVKRENKRIPPQGGTEGGEELVTASGHKLANRDIPKKKNMKGRRWNFAWGTTEKKFF